MEVAIPREAVIFRAAVRAVFPAGEASISRGLAAERDLSPVPRDLSPVPVDSPAATHADSPVARIFRDAGAFRMADGRSTAASISRAVLAALTQASGAAIIAAADITAAIAATTAVTTIPVTAMDTAITAGLIAILTDTMTSGAIGSPAAERPLT